MKNLILLFSIVGFLNQNSMAQDENIFKEFQVWIAKLEDRKALITTNYFKIYECLDSTEYIYEFDQSLFIQGSVKTLLAVLGGYRNSLIIDNLKQDKVYQFEIDFSNKDKNSILTEILDNLNINVEKTNKNALIYKILIKNDSLLQQRTVTKEAKRKNDNIKWHYTGITLNKLLDVIEAKKNIIIIHGFNDTKYDLFIYWHELELSLKNLNIILLERYGFELTEKEALIEYIFITNR